LSFIAIAGLLVLDEGVESEEELPLPVPVEPLPATLVSES